MPITTLFFSFDPQSTGAQVGDSAYYISNSSFTSNGGFNTSSSLDQIVNMGTITSFGFQNSSSVSAVKATHVTVFSDEAFTSGNIIVSFTANSTVSSNSYPNIADFPEISATNGPSTFSIIYQPGSGFTQNQIVQAGLVVSFNNYNTPIIAMAESATAAGRAANFKSAIEFAAGSAITCALSTTSATNDTVTMTQAVAGESGNLPVQDFIGDMDSITSSFPNAFTGGAETTTSFDFYTMTVETSNLYNLPTTNDYIFFSQDNAINLSSLVGYFAEAKIRNNSTEFAEMFSLSAGVVESSK
tara:strand:+ start:888 stop:1787 length:900 start_codon:yes stop_codon:yes gene_type:complete